MKYNKYIVAHAPGSSGRFISKILDRLILNSEKPIDIFPNNSTHAIIPNYASPVLQETALRKINKEEYTGVSIPDLNNSNLYNTFYFDLRGRTYSSILTTHVYPDFIKINEKYDDLGIIIVNFSESDVKEISFNSAYKNKNIQIPNSRLDVASKFFLEKYTNFMKIQNIPENCLILQYTDLYRDLTDKLNTINQLKEFAEISNNPNSVINAHKQYLEGRTRIVNEFGLR